MDSCAESLAQFLYCHELLHLTSTAKMVEGWTRVRKDVLGGLNAIICRQLDDYLGLLCAFSWKQLLTTERCIFRLLGMFKVCFSPVFEFCDFWRFWMDKFVLP